MTTINSVPEPQVTADPVTSAIQEGLVIIPASFQRSASFPCRLEIDKAVQNVTDGIWKCVWQSSGGLQKPGQTPSPLQITDNGPWA